LGIKIVREGNACDRCKKQNTEVGKVTHYTSYGEDLLLCESCIEITDKEKTLKCPKCKKVVGTEGMTEYKTKSMCYKCKEKAVAREEKTQERIRFFKKYWYVWFGGFIAFIIAFLF